MNLQKKQNTNKIEKDKKLLAGSFIYSIIGFLALLAIAIVYLLAGGTGAFKVIDIPKNIVDIIGYAMIGVAVATCCLTAILNIAFLTKNKSKLCAFLIITLTFNLIFPILLIVSFVLFTIILPTQSEDQFYIWFYFASIIAVLFFAFLQVVSNGVTFGQIRKNSVSKNKQEKSSKKKH